MAIDYASLKAFRFDDRPERYDVRDTMLYALGVGLGADPLDGRQLRYVYEQGLETLPTFALVRAQAAPWITKIGIDYRKMLHGEQSIDIHSPLPPEGELRGESAIEEIVDKGEDKGAVIYTRRVIKDAATGEAYATVRASLFCRADGGFGGPVTAAPRPRATPERAPDLSVDLPTLPQAALLYRLSGDYNPLHASPAAAGAAGFARPILHGLCTFAVAGHAVLREIAQYRSVRVKHLAGRFSAPVFPGETIRTELWREGGEDIAFRCRIVERDIVAISNGWARVSEAA